MVEKTIIPESLRHARLLIGFVAATSLASSLASESPGPAATVDRLQQGLVMKDQDTRALPLEMRIDAYGPLISSTHDLARMAQLSLSRDWRTLNDEQRALFVEKFSELTIRSYANRFSQIDDAKFRMFAVRNASRGRVEVRTELRLPLETPVDLNYLLHETDQGWRIINVFADGVSELALQRGEYRAILQNEGFDALTNHITQQISKLKPPVE